MDSDVEKWAGAAGGRLYLSTLPSPDASSVCKYLQTVKVTAPGPAACFSRLHIRVERNEMDHALVLEKEARSDAMRPGEPQSTPLSSFQSCSIFVINI